MSLHHFFLDDQVLSNEAEEVFPLGLSAADLKHWRVLRLRAGEHVAVVDASQDYFEVEVVDAPSADAICEGADTDQPWARIAGHIQAKPMRVRIVLAQGLAKGDKMEQVIRHATELGVAAFVPLVCERSVMRVNPGKEQKKVQRWYSIARSAAMQSGARIVPEVHAPCSVVQLAQKAQDAGVDALCVCWEEAPQSVGFPAALRSVVQRLDTEREAGRQSSAEGASEFQPTIVIVVGPEGGLTQGEVDALLAASPNAHLVSLGSNILRTETAGVVAPALALYELGGLGKC